MAGSHLQFRLTLVVDIKRLTALWAFSEATLGSILHIIKIPFSGIFMGGAAVVFISLIGRYSKDKSAILHSTLLVILVKAVVSPQSPLTSYFAVSLQGILGYILFSYIKNEKVSTVLLSFLSLLFSALQRLIVLTILFGFTFWDAIDSFTHYVAAQMHIDHYLSSFSLSLFLILLYCTIHIYAGIYIGLRVNRIPEWLEKKTDLVYPLYSSFYYSMDYFKNNKKKKRHWWQRPSGILIISFSILFMILSYYSKEFGQSKSFEILLMIIRSFIITFVWFSIISPYILKHFNKFLESNKFKYAPEINKITALFPSIKRLINYAWFTTDQYMGILRISKFISNSVALLLTADIDEEPFIYYDGTD